MDLSYNVVASKCAEQMARYQACVTANVNGDWANVCRPQGQALAQCADDSVPHLAELKSTCAKEIGTYRSCLDATSGMSDEEVGAKCGGMMADLWKCSEKAMEIIEGRQGSSGSATQGSERVV